MTAQEVGQFYLFGLKTIIFILNSNDYMIVEKMLSKKLDYCYNYLAQWHYHKLPEIFGCEGWLVRKAITYGDLYKIMTEVDNTKTGAYKR